jgi:hypothetical protein
LTNFINYYRDRGAITPKSEKLQGGPDAVDCYAPSSFNYVTVSGVSTSGTNGMGMNSAVPATASSGIASMGNNFPAARKPLINVDKIYKKSKPHSYHPSASKIPAKSDRSQHYHFRVEDKFK